MRDLAISVVLATVLAFAVGLSGMAITPNTCGNFEETTKSLVSQSGGNLTALRVTGPLQMEYVDVQQRVTIEKVPEGIIVERPASTLPPVKAGDRLFDAGMFTVRCTAATNP